ncbi:uncharacterized protein [Physcomitrium patens]|uniref:CID domain-containing protein n=1 Tax=Physcomitrium patens TaxID=3218 RepID=A0A2K1J3V9_PHYPA|nr:calcium homeostasis endoplasmic reticulum protein-like [Physcomitrium patens]PNR36219.1 hypothetical protein PHYPA_022070 [Physcomitrium patens]|eukprot:XP_024401408.1 calcium homeostasis endoplasmic reticulum protein-like [Physcomitrella patens]
MEQGQGYGRSYVPQPPLPIPPAGLAQMHGMQQYAPPPPFPYHAPQYPYPAGPARSVAVPPAAVPPQGPGLGLAAGFFNPWEPPPAPVQPPADNDLQKRIDKLVEYACKNGPQFEALMKDKQKENPLYSFLFGAEGHDYYRYKLWQTLNPVQGNPLPATVPSYNPTLAGFNATQSTSLAPGPGPGLAGVNSPLNPALASSLKPALSAAPPVPLPSAFPSAYIEQQHHSQPFYDQFQHESYGEVNYQQAPVAPHSGPLPADIASQMKGILDNLTGTKESIKGAKMWFMQRAAYGPALVEVLKERVLSMDDVERQLHIIYLANEILFSSLQHRTNLKEFDPEALAFKPALGGMLAAIYHNPKDMAMNQDRLQKILQFWGAKEVYDMDTINTLEGEMVAGPPPPEVPTMKPSSAVPFQYGSQWQSDQASQPSSNAPPQQTEQPQSSSFPGAPQFYGAGVQFNSSNPAQQYIASPVPSLYPALAGPPFLAPLPSPVPIQTPPLAALPTPVRPTDQTPYPLFPPGLIPGMVRKMQIGSGVPYSPLSPLDIPTVIPPSTASDSYILERVTKFFKEIGEVDPLEGQVAVNDAKNHDDEGDEDIGREGGARIPPPNSMQIDSEVGTMQDGSLEHRPGMTSSGRLGLGASADPNEVTQYDDVYTSYRKQRSTNYHTTLSARAAAR